MKIYNNYQIVIFATSYAYEVLLFKKKPCVPMCTSENLNLHVEVIKYRLKVTINFNLLA
jgi:hypothetical protein